MALPGVGASVQKFWRLQGRMVSLLALNAQGVATCRQSARFFSCRAVLVWPAVCARCCSYTARWRYAQTLASRYRQRHIIAEV